MLDISDGIHNLGSINIPLAISLFVAWLIVFGALSKGVQSLGKISYFTATFPYLMLTILVVKGALLGNLKRLVCSTLQHYHILINILYFGSFLEGADKGIEYYIGKFEIAKLG